MKTKTTCKSWTTLSFVSVASSIITMALPSVPSAGIEPVGTSTRAVRFDAVIELNRYSRGSARHYYTLMFARYWVARDYYSAAVVWAEPESTDLYFAVQPPILTVASDEHGFDVCHESIKKDEETHKKPLGERGPFRHMYGFYPIANIRFAEQEALAERVYAADLKDLKDAGNGGRETFDVSIPVTEGKHTRDVAKLKVNKSAGRIDSMQLFNAGQQLLKDLSYEYDSNGGKTHLRRQTVALPARPMMVGFNGKGMKVTLGGKEHWYKDLEATHHAGGRTCTVEYEPVRLGDKEVTLPVKVTVRDGKDGRILRSVRMMNFEHVEMDAAGAEEAARRLGAVSAEQREYDRLRVKYWKKAPCEIDEEDVKAIEQLRTHFEKAAAGGSNTGEKLKHLNILMQLNGILGDRSALERHYKDYLSTLTQNRLLWMTLVGGYGVIETSMLAERPSDAQKLLSLWVNAVLDIHDAQSLLLFARRQLAKERWWPTIKLLESFSSKYHSDVGARFEADVLKCTALAALCKLPRTTDVAKEGLIAKVQTDWVASIGKDELEKMLANGVSEARRSFGGIPEPTEFQQVLKKQLDELDKGINQTNNN